MWPPHRNTRPPRCSLGWWRLLLAALPFWANAESFDLDEELKVPSAWIKSVDLRLWSGYKDNVLLGDRNAVESPFFAGGLDLTFYRLPTDGWEYLLVSSAEYLRYLTASQVDQEATAIGQAQVKKTVAEDWKAAVSAEYVYFNQVFDASTTEEELRAVQVEGHGFTVRPAVTKDLPRSFRLELELPATRQLFAEFIDDYWEFGPKLILAREYDRKATLSVAYQFSDRIHDTREARDEAGVVQGGRSLAFYQHEVSGVWRQFWDAHRRWRTVTRLSLQRNEDNGGGYYDYLRPQFSEQLRYQAPTWEVRAEARISYYHYDRQHIAELDSPTRKKAYLRLNLRADKTIVKSLKVFAQYEHERAISNLDFDEYRVNVLSAGMNWEF